MTFSSPSAGGERRRGLRAATLVVVAAGLAVITATWRDYGITWDEAVGAAYGDRVLDYFLSGLRDTDCNHYLNFRFYGPLFDLAGSIAARWSGGHAFAARHLLIALTGLAAVVGTLRVAALAGGPRAAGLAALALATMPRFYGNAFTNPKDIPFAAAMTWAVFALLCWLSRREPRRREAVFAGIATGAALAVRPGGLPLLAAMLAVALTAHLVFVAEGRRRRPTASLLLQAALAIGFAWATMVAPWPWAHEAVFAHPWQAVKEAANFSTAFDVLYDGQTWRSDRLPRSYLPKYLLITTPPWTLALALLALLRVPSALRSSREGFPTAAFVTFWALAPIAAVVLLRPNVYDGIRHFLFLLPPIAVLAGLGAAEVSRRIERSAMGRFGPAIVATALLLPVPEMIRLHPYQSTYFNGLVGGVGGAASSYETDYWTQSYKEAIEWVNAQPVPPGGRVQVLVVANFYNSLCAEAYLAPHVKMEAGWGLYPDAALPQEYDYFVAMTRYGADRSFPESPVVHVVGRGGAAFTVIKSSRPRPTGGRPQDGETP